MQTRFHRLLSSFSKRTSELQIMFEKGHDYVGSEWNRKRKKNRRKIAKKLGFEYVKSDYGVYLKSNWSDNTFKFCIDAEYGHFYSNYLKAIEHDFVFVDVGANQGLYTLLAARNQRCRRAIAFEPVTETYALLLDNIHKNNVSEKVEVHNLAISDTNGKTQICFSSSHSGLASLRNTELESIRDTTSIETVNFEKLQSLVPGDAEIYLKIDVEGFEEVVLRQFLLADVLPRVRAVFYEVDDRWTNSMEIQRMLESVGFTSFTKTAFGHHYDVLASRVHANISE